MSKSKVHRPAHNKIDGSSPENITPKTEMGLERIVFFSDAVIAIAITLLAIEIRLPDIAIPRSELVSALIELAPRYLSFLISFFVISVFWLSHHRMFEYVHTYDRGLIWINLIFLLLIASMPFPTAVLGRFPGAFTAVVFYAVVVILLSLVRIWCWWYVYYRTHLVRPDTDPRLGRFEFFRPAATAVVFGLSILIAFWNPTWAMLFWGALLPISSINGSRVARF